MIPEFHKYLRERGFICSYKSSDRLSFWRSISPEYYWQIDMSSIDDQTWIAVRKYSNIDIKFSETYLIEGKIDSIVELAVILKIFEIN